MKKYNLITGHLVEGQKITLVYQGEFGGVTAIPTTYLGCKPAPHYANCPDDMVGVAILHRPRNKRKAGYRTIPFNISLIVYNGWKDIDADALVFKQLDDNLKESRHTMFDNVFFTDLLATMTIYTNIIQGLARKTRNNHTK